MENIIFGNSNSKLIFDGEKGYLLKIQYKDLFIPVNSKLWAVETVSGEITIEDMNEFYTQQYNNLLKLFWKSEKALVAVTVRAEENDKIRLNINVDLYEKNAVNKVIFPLIQGMNFENDNYIISTWQNGHIIKNPVENLFKKEVQTPFWMGRGKGCYENDYPAGLSFQFASFYSPSEFGYYFGTEDENAFIKTYTYKHNKETDCLDFYVTNYPENMGKTLSYSMPYDFVLAMFEGDWQVPANIYREWAVNQKWCKEPLYKKHIPSSVKKTDFWRINHTNGKLGTRTQEYFDTSVMLRDYLDCNIALHWYGWNTNHKHDWDTPDYFPQHVRDMGWPEKLKEWNNRFEEEGIVRIPYTNARLWERTTKSWDTYNATAAAIKGEDGKIFLEPWTPEQNLTTICPSTTMWQNRVVEMVREFVLDEGFSGAYLDQVASFNAMLCFDETHPHPRGGGSWWNDSYHRMLANVRNIFGEEKIMTTESCCETYIDVFDLFLVLDHNFQHTGFNEMAEAGVSASVPLFNMIYGNYALSYGSICCFEYKLDGFEYNYIRNILWGSIPSVEAGTMEQLTNGKGYLDALKRGVDFYKEYKDILMYGRLTKVLDCKCDNFEIEWAGTGKNGEFAYSKAYPVIYAVEWESIDGEKMIFAYNYADKPSNFELNGKEYEVNAKSFIKI